MKKQSNLLLISAAVALAISSSRANADQPALPVEASSSLGNADQQAVPVSVSSSPGNASSPPILQQLNEVTVTGTLLGHNLGTFSPVAVATDTQLAQMGTVNIDDYLNDMPEITAGENNTANFPGNGTETVDLRGFGANRTLVLVDGMRFVPTNSDGSVDISAFPAALIKRVDVVTGGESAIYGSDAITGVVNFILKDDFQGFQFDANDKVTSDYDDGNTASFDAIAGTNFADGRGHVMGYVDYTNQDPILEGDRPYTSYVLNDGTVNGKPALVMGGSSAPPETNFALPSSVIPTTLPGYNQSGEPVNSITFNSMGDPLAFEKPQDLYDYGPPSYMQIPVNRFETHIAVDYDLTPDMDYYLRVTNMRQESDTNGAPAPVFIYSSNDVDFNYADNPYLSPASKSILAAAAKIVNPQFGLPANNGTILLEGLFSRLPNTIPRTQDYTRDTYQVSTGVKGGLFNSGWNYDVYFQQGVATTDESNYNALNHANFYQALNATTGPNGQPECINPSGGCQPIDIWGDNGNGAGITSGALSYVLTGYNSSSKYTFENAVANVNGNLPDWFSLKAGPITTAFGADWEKYEYQSRADSGSTVNGVPILPTYGTYNVAETYGEINVPVLKDSMLAKSLNVRGSLRYSEYNTSGSATTYSAGGDWSPPDVGWIQLRGSTQRAIRAPNIVELFAPLEGAGLTIFSDPCDKATGLLHTAAQQSFCNVWGAPTGFTAENASVSAIAESNSHLKPETSNSYTVGTVIRPPIPSRYLNSLDISVDYYNIALTNAIAPFGGGVADQIDSCYFSLNLASPFCAGLKRNPLGDLDPVVSELANVSLKSTTGMDGQMYMNFDMSEINSHLRGNMSVNFASNYEFKNGFQASSALPYVNCAGYFGTPCGAEITGSGQPKWRNNTTFTWSHSAYSATLRWRWIQGMTDARVAQAAAYGFSVAQQEASIPPGALHTPNVNYLDASVSWQATKALLITIGGTNITDRTPPLLGSQQVQDNTDPDTYDPTGRWVWASLKLYLD
jgi:iron complex outermembrane recepter protein